MNSKQLRTPLRVSLVLAAFLLVCGIAIAQDDQVKGVINGLSGAVDPAEQSYRRNVNRVVSTVSICRPYTNDSHTCNIPSHDCVRVTQFVAQLREGLNQACDADSSAYGI